MPLRTPLLASAVPILGASRGRGRGLLSIVQLVFAVLFHVGASYGLPHASVSTAAEPDEDVLDPKDPKRWIYLIVALALCLLGGIFAGLTIALMGQDTVYLQVISTSGEGSEKKHASRVLKLLNKGKHWVLVTILIGNVITNEFLPIVLEKSTGGGYAAAIVSTILVIIFGEIIPQSICVRYGLTIGAWCSRMVLILMWLSVPITWPIAKLLDFLLGVEHGTTYKKAGLKTLVTLHKTLGGTPTDRLNEDEVQIISGVLDLKDKAVGAIMTPMSDVFTLSADAILDEELIEDIMREGYSRIPIHEPNNKGDFVGMLLVKMLITYDPEDCKRVNAFDLATLPETRPDTSCLDIINFFQEGKSHMVLVSACPGEPYGALGVVTLEDVIEELIGEEIIDESDVFVDVHKAVRRLAPAPMYRHRGRLHEGSQTKTEANGNSNEPTKLTRSIYAKRPSVASIDPPHSPIRTRQILRRANSHGSSQLKGGQMANYPPDVMEHLKHLGPSNKASKPQTTRISTVKVKQGTAKVPESPQAAQAPAQQMSETRLGSNQEVPRVISPEPTGSQGGIGTGLVSSGHQAKDGVQSMQAAYGTWGRTTSGTSNTSRGESKERPVLPRLEEVDSPVIGSQREPRSTRGSTYERPQKIIFERQDSQTTLGSMHVDTPGGRATARSGSITEQVIEIGGRRKLVLDLEPPSSGSDDGESIRTGTDSKDIRTSQNKSQQGSSQGGISSNTTVAGEGEQGEDGEQPKKKRRHRGFRNRRKNRDGKKDGDENSPLLGGPPRSN